MYPLSAVLVIADHKLLEEVESCLREARVRVQFQQPAIARWSEFLVQIERTRPDMLVFGLTPAADGLEEAIRRVRTVSQAPIVVVHDSVDAETILGAIRAGAREYLYPPVRSGLEKALQRIAADRSKDDSARGLNAKVMGFVSAKGGCGATTLACHVAAELQRVSQKEILVADLDPTSGMIAFLLRANGPYSIVDAAQNTHRLDLSFWKALVAAVQPHLEVIPAPRTPALAEAAEPERLRSVIRFARSNYDCILCDFGRGLTPPLLAMLEELDELHLVANLEVPALYQAKNVAQRLRELGFSENRLRLILNRAPKQADFTSAEIEKLLGLPIYRRLPNSYPELYEAYAEGRLVSPETQLGKSVSGLVADITGTKKEEKAARSFSLFGAKKVAPGWGGA